MKKIFLFVSLLLFLCANCFSDETSDILQKSVWYRENNGIIEMMLFNETECVRMSFALIGSGHSVSNSFPNNKKAYKIIELGRMELDGIVREFVVTPAFLVFKDVYSGGTAQPTIFSPMPQQDIKKLPGTWKAASTDYDVEVVIDSSTVKITRGKNSNTWNYTCKAFPKITYSGEGVNKYYPDRNFLFFDNDTIALLLPDNTFWLLKRQN
jgi:hypothetical protein